MDEVIHKAIQFACMKHDGQYRKNIKVPYISHIMEVYGILLESGCNPETVAGGILHDILEDTATTREELAEQFGNEIAELVSCETEDKENGINKRVTWKKRKQATIDRLPNSSDAIKKICCADKLSNLSGLYFDSIAVGEKIWDNFNAGKADIQWYYREIIKTLDLDDFAPYQKLKMYFEKTFGAGSD